MSVNDTEHLRRLRIRSASYKSNLTKQNKFLTMYKQDESFYADLEHRLNVVLPKIMSDFTGVQDEIVSINSGDMSKQNDYRKKFKEYYREVERNFRNKQIEAPTYFRAQECNVQKVKVECHDDNMMNTCDGPVSSTIETRSLNQSPKYVGAPHSQLQGQTENLLENKNNDELVLNNHEDANQLENCMQMESVSAVSSTFQPCNDVSNQILPSIVEDTSRSKSTEKALSDCLCQIMSKVPEKRRINLYMKFIKDAIKAVPDK